MNVNIVRYVLAVHKEGGFGKAAASIGVSQPTLSLGIKRLESELGLRLLDRNAPAQLTGDGRVLLRLFEQLDRCAHNISTAAHFLNESSGSFSKSRLHHVVGRSPRRRTGSAD